MVICHMGLSLVVELLWGTALGGRFVMWDSPGWRSVMGDCPGSCSCQGARTALGDRSVIGEQPWVILLSWGTALGDTAVMRDCPWW